MNKLFDKLIKTSMEEAAVTDEVSVAPVSEDTKPADKTQREDEIVFYATVGDFEGLKQACSKEHHDQWEVKTEHGRFRVRKISKESLDPVFEQTVKINSKNAGLDGSEEKTYSINEDLFKAIEMICERGMIKDRYCFPVGKLQITTDSGIKDVAVDNVYFEVDVFFNEDGSYNPNVKIDLEVNKILDKLKESNPDLGEFNLNVRLLDLPFKPTDVIVGNKNTSDEDKQKIDNLYDTVFITKK
jgi:hypothetical protein